MTELEKFLIQPEMCMAETRYFVVERLGEDHPIGLKTITNADHSKAMSSATKINKDGKVSFDNQTFLRAICTAGIVEPQLTSVEWMNSANEIVNKTNAKLLEDEEKRYEKALKEWEEKGSEGQKPTKRKMDLMKEINNAGDMLDFVFRPGEIEDISNTILKISGFGENIKEIEKKAKN